LACRGPGRHPARLVPASANNPPLEAPEVPLVRGSQDLPREPRSTAWPPDWDGAVVFVVGGAEPLAERRLLVPVDEGDHRGGEDRGVAEQSELTEQQRLPDDEGRHSEVHRVVHVAVEATDDKMLGRRDRGRCADALKGASSRFRDRRTRPGGPAAKGSRRTPVNAAACRPGQRQARDDRSGKERRQSQAARRYSWISPPNTSTRRTDSTVTGSTSLSRGAGRGGCKSRLRCGRTVL
jgi:hypothetical protein